MTRVQPWATPRLDPVRTRLAASANPPLDGGQPHPRCVPPPHVVTELCTLWSVFGYLDPGTGSMLVQLVVGGVAAAAVTAKFYWRRLLTFLRIRKPEPEPEQER